MFGLMRRGRRVAPIAIAVAVLALSSPAAAFDAAAFKAELAARMAALKAELIARQQALKERLAAEQAALKLQLQQQQAELRERLGRDPVPTPDPEPDPGSGGGDTGGSQPDTTPPSKPSNVSATTTACETVVVSWGGSSDSQSGIDRYEVLRDGSEIGSVSAAKRSYTDTDFSASKIASYGYAVRAVNGEGLEAVSGNATTTVDVCQPEPDPEPDPGSGGGSGASGEVAILTGDSDPFNGGRGVAVGSDWAVVTGWAKETSDGAWLKVVDLRDPSAPVLAGEVREAGAFGDAVVFDGSYAYALVADGSSQGSDVDLVVVDVRTPTDPREVGRLGIPGGKTYNFSSGLDMAGGLVYVAGTDAGLFVVDVANASQPRIVGELAIDAPRDVAVDGGLAAVVSDDLFLVDVSTPSDPTLVAYQSANNQRISAVELANGTFWRQDDNAIVAYRVSGSSLSLDGVILEGRGWSFTHAEGRLYVRRGSLVVVLDADTLAEVGSFTTPGLGTAIDVDQGLVAVGDNVGQIAVIELTAN